MISEQEFQTHCDHALSTLYKSLLAASDTHDFEVDQNAGTITIEFEEPRAKFVVSPNSPVRQIWLSALTRSFKFDWDAAASEFVLPDGKTLRAMVAEAISTQMGEDVRL